MKCILLFISAPPSAPNNLRIIEVYKDYIVIAWDDPEFDGGEPIRGYTIEKSLSGGTFVGAGSVGFGENKFKVIKNDHYTEVHVLVYGFISMEKQLFTSLAPFTHMAALVPRLRHEQCIVSDALPQWVLGGHKLTHRLVTYVLRPHNILYMCQYNSYVITDLLSHVQVTKLYENSEYLFRVLAENKVGQGPPVTTDKPTKAKLPFGILLYLILLTTTQILLSSIFVITM